jgi:hypothetical protein
VSTELRDPYLTYLIFSALFEGVSALNLLHSAGIAGQLPHSKAWPVLNGIRLRWDNDKTLREIRHVFGHHLGAKEIARGLERLPHGRAVPVIQWFGKGPFGMSFPITVHALCAGVSMQQEDLTLRFGAQSIVDGKAYPENVVTLLFELLEKHGIRVPNV